MKSPAGTTHNSPEIHFRETGGKQKVIMAHPLLSDRFVEINAVKIQMLIDENRILRQEIRVAREAAEITASLVVKQFEETEKILERFQKTNALQKAVLNSAKQMAIIAADREGTITVFNSGAENLLGYKASEVIGIHSPELFFSESELIRRSRELSAEYRRNIRIPNLLFEYAVTGYSAYQEWTLTRKDGSQFPATMNINALKDADDTFSGFLCFATDISEKKRAEKALHESEKKFRMLINNLPNIVARGYVDGRMDVFDDKIERLTGYSKEDFLSRKLRWTDIVLPEDRPILKQVFWDSFYNGDKSYIRQYRIRSKNGRIVWIEEGSQIVCNERGEIEYISGAFLDISERKQAEDALKKAHEELEQRVSERTAELRTEIRERRLAEEALKRSEEKYRSMFENATDGIFQTTPAGHIMTANLAFANILGYDSPQHVIACISNVREQLYVYPEKREELQLMLEKYGTVRDFETQFYRKDGSVIHVSMNVRAVRNDSGDIVCYEGMLKNVTQRKRAEQLKIEKDAAEAATKAKSEFLANMSHEIRTPMNAIIGLTDLMRRTELNPKQSDYLEKVQLSAHSLLRIINDILDFSKIEAGKLHLEDADFQLRTLLDNLSDMFCSKAAEKGIELIVSVADNVPGALVGDSLRLSQILTNLTANAVKFTSQGEVFIRVNLIKKEAGRARLRFSVKDSGIGIPMSQLSKLFSAFTQADSSTTRKYGGTGLGLAISRKLVELMKGEIWAESDIGMGSTFYFTAEFGLQAEDREMKPLIPDKLRDMKVLVVDDNIHSQKILEEYLSTFRFSTTLAGSGQEAIQTLTRDNSDKTHDLVIIDWMMPEMDGIMTLQKMRENSKLVNIPVIMMTAFGREEVMKQAEAAGVNAFLIKPIKQSVLLDTIMDVFGHSAVLSSVTSEPTLTSVDAEMFWDAKILLAEDNAINRQIAKEILSNAGMLVETAENGQEAITKIFQAFSDGQYAYDAVLMDVQMPEMDGYEATRRIREWEESVTHNTPIIAMTAHAMMGDKEKCLNAGMNDYVTKPIDTERLFEVLGKWIKKKEFNVQSAKRSVETDDSILTLTTSHLPPIDTDAALKRLSGNERLLQNLIQQFGQTYSGVADQIRNAVAMGDMPAALRSVHTIKGVAGNISAIRLHEAAAKLEDALRNSKRKEITDLTDKFAKALEEMIVLSESRKPASSAPIPQQETDTDIRNMILKLYALLGDNDLDAEEFFDSIKANIVRSDIDMNMDILEKNIRKLDFEKARQTLRKISKSLDIFIPED